MSDKECAGTNKRQMVFNRFMESGIERENALQGIDAVNSGYFA